MLTLTPIQRRALRAGAHALHPVVAIGHHGLTPSVLHEIDVALLAHELIKVRVFGDDRAEREAVLARICDEVACAPVQHIGKLLVLWRPNPERKERIAKKPVPKKPVAARQARGPVKPKLRTARTGEAPAGKRAPAARRRRSDPKDMAPPGEPRGDQARRRRRASTT